MADLPLAGYLSDAARTQAEVKASLEALVAATRQLPGAGGVFTGLTIAAGSITPTLGEHVVDTEAAAATDDLANIAQTNISDGRLLMLRTATTARVVVVKHAAGGAGQITLAAGQDRPLRQQTQWILLKRVGTIWEEIALAGQGTRAGTISMWPTSTVPPDCLLCNGAAVSRAVYAALFAAIGTFYGAGDGSTTFNVPDIRNRTVFGNAGSGLFVLGATGGESLLPNHTHNVVPTGTAVEAGFAAEPAFSQFNLLASFTSHTHANNPTTNPTTQPPIINPFLCLNFIIQT